jgi:hypothetical protein
MSSYIEPEEWLRTFAESYNTVGTEAAAGDRIVFDDDIKERLLEAARTIENLRDWLYDAENAIRWDDDD